MNMRDRRAHGLGHGFGELAPEPGQFPVRVQDVDRREIIGGRADQMDRFGGRRPGAAELGAAGRRTRREQDRGEQEDGHPRPGPRQEIGEASPSVHGKYARITKHDQARPSHGPFGPSPNRDARWAPGKGACHWPVSEDEARMPTGQYIRKLPESGGCQYLGVSRIDLGISPGWMHPQGLLDQVRQRPGLHLFHKVGAVELHGLLAQIERVGDPLVGFARDDAIENLALPRR